MISKKKALLEFRKQMFYALVTYALEYFELFKEELQQKEKHSMKMYLKRLQSSTNRFEANVGEEELRIVETLRENLANVATDLENNIQDGENKKKKSNTGKSG